MSWDWRTYTLVTAVLAVLMAATIVVQMLRRQPASGLDLPAVRNFNQRIRAWWLMAGVLVAAFLMGPVPTVILFFGISFWALREYITVTPTRTGDHRALFWVFFLFTPLQYVLVAWEKYGLYSVLIPVYGFLFIFARVALAGDSKRFLFRTANIQAGLMICVYCLSYAPALLSLELRPELLTPRPVTASTQGLTEDPKVNAAPEALPDAETDDLKRNRRNMNTRLLLFLIVVVQAGEALQFLIGKWLGKQPIAPAITPGRTWEGFLGSAAGTALLGATLWWATPFNPLEAAGMALVINVMGFAGGLTMSAIKRDRGVEDYGTLVEGHGGVLDRIDSICFAAPVFFHFTRFFFTDVA
jgi:phosphatidate cytidylyltransferase